MTPELRQPRATLDGLRASVLKKLAGLSEGDARRSMVDSGTNLAGLVQHLTFVESLWFEEIVAGRKATRGDRSMRVDPSVSLRTVRRHHPRTDRRPDRPLNRRATQREGTSDFIQVGQRL